MSLRDLPDVFTIPEAAALLGIARNTAYDQARLWRATGGREGLPVLTLGSRLLVSKAQLERMLGIEPAERDGNPIGAASEARMPAVEAGEVPEQSGRVATGSGDPERGARRASLPQTPSRRRRSSPRRASPNDPSTAEPSQLTLFNPEPQPPTPPGNP